MRLLPLVVSLLCTCYCSAQQLFNVTNVNNLSVNVGNEILGFGLSSYDFNKDGWDDLTFATQGNGIYLFVNDEGEYALFDILPNSGSARSVLWADYDNDGDADLFVSNTEAPCRLFNNDGECNLTDVASEAGIPISSTALSYGAAWSDIDSDGDLDLYICNYNWGTGIPNWLMINQGDGTFIESAEEFGIANGSLPSFMPCFGDFNNDLLPDLYVINDKAPHNALFISDPEIGFVDISESSNTDLQIDAMSNTVGDYDNDGDLDIYVSNNSDGNSLLRNNGDLTFTEQAIDLGVGINRFSWGALWFDLNNDRYLDLFVSTHSPLEGNSNPYFRNNSGNSFTEQALFTPSNLTPSFANSYLDFNNDGALDLVQINAGIFGVTLWSNNNVEGNWLKVNLEGTISNKDGIGAWVEVYSGGEVSKHYTLCGEGYLSQRSQHIHFGLGEAEVVDSLIVKWPQGWVDKFYDLNANHEVTFVEGSSFAFSLNVEPVLYICEGDSITLDGGEFSTYLWSNGSTERFVTLFEPAEIEVQVANGKGFSAVSQTVMIENAPPFEYEIYTNEVFCYGDSTGAIELIADSEFEILWSTNDSSTLLQNLPAGVYEAIVLDSYGCTSTISTQINQNPEIQFSGETTDATCFGENTGAIAPFVSGGFGTFDFNGSLKKLVAGEYVIYTIDELGCEASATFEINEPNALAISFDVTHSIDGVPGLISSFVTGGTTPYTIIWSNAANTFTIANLVPGNYILNVTDANGCQLSAECEVESVNSLYEEQADLFEIYPNPTDGQLYFQNFPYQNALVTVYNALGQCVFSQKVSSKSINLSHLSSGTYTILVEAAEFVVRKVIIIR